MDFDYDKKRICELVLSMQEYLTQRSRVTTIAERSEIDQQISSVRSLLLSHKVAYKRKGGLILTHYASVSSEHQVTESDLVGLNNYFAAHVGLDSAKAIFDEDPMKPFNFMILVDEREISKLVELDAIKEFVSASDFHELDFTTTYIASLDTLQKMKEYLDNVSVEKNML